MANITDWNVEPNKQYFVKLTDTGTGVKVWLYNTQAYAVAGTNLVASGLCGYGTDQACSLSNKGTYPSVTRFNHSKDYYLKVTFGSGESTAIFKIGPFYDKDINEVLLSSVTMQEDRAAAEINKGTHCKDIKTLTMNTHDPTIRDGLVVTLNTTKFPNQEHLIKRVTISGSGGGLILDELEIYRYENLNLY